ncbi:MAG: hypothetical protein ABW252_15630 [Polyangiales bacterium]
MGRNVWVLAFGSGLVFPLLGGCDVRADDTSPRAARTQLEELELSRDDDDRDDEYDEDGGRPPRFSFFVTSLRAMRELSRSANGFGGDLRFGERGEGAGLRGADKICATIAEDSMPGAGSKVWRAFLSATEGGRNGGPVHAKDRIGNGPWYDRVGRIVALSKRDLLEFRPAGADSRIEDDLPNEDGIPNHDPDGTGAVDNHNTLTGTDDEGALYSDDPRSTCNDWTNGRSDVKGSPRVGHSWLRTGSEGIRLLSPSYGHWISYTNLPGCGAGVSLGETSGFTDADNRPIVGARGGYGGIYCFALAP